MRVDCVNCGERTPARQSHLYLGNHEVVEVTLCEGCRRRFVTADWVRAVV